jgi:tetratricopeptide (TPR) repeat protein
VTRAQELEDRVDALEADGRFDEAVATLEQLAEATGEDQRPHIAWMKVRGHRFDEAAALWAEMRAERPDDPGVPYLEASAYLEDGDAETAAPLLEEALAMALRVGSDATMARRIADDRTAALRATGAAPTDVDRAARMALERTAVAAPWFAPAEHTRALEAWPAFAEETGGLDHAAYSRALDERMRGGEGRRPVLVDLTVDEVEAWATEHGWDPGWGLTHAQVAAEAARGGRGRPWPPGRNEPCWCGSGRKHKRCCGA